MNVKKGFLFLFAAAAMIACNGPLGQNVQTESGLQTQNFDTVINEKPVRLYVLRNHQNMEVCITNFGGRIVSVMVPDKNGQLQDVVLGYDNIAQYADIEGSPSDFGAAIGRYANRINQGRIVVDGKTIQLPQNNFGHCLHGGPTGWQYQVYEAEQKGDSVLTLTMHSPDGDNNFPGNVAAKVVYKLTEKNEIDICYEATTDKETVINMTNHSYFNLNGDPTRSATDMVLSINADKFTPTDTTYMPTGEVRSVEGTPMDFRLPVALKERIPQTDYDQIKYAGEGLDHNWCLNTYTEGHGDDSQVAASLYSPLTGIKLEVLTNEPGIQVYTGNFLGTSDVAGKRGIVYPKQSAVCLETQHYPDSPNHPEWASPWLKPGEKYQSHCVYRFSVVR
ncbi:putative aldose 1-epimerase [Bacteroidales bacterium KA00344]|nr:putative aldose 1-epimerase [Bacteroidales bacterium KA00344]